MHFIITNKEFGYSHYSHEVKTIFICAVQRHIANFGRNSLTFRGSAFYNRSPLGIRQIQNRATFQRAWLYRSSFLEHVGEYIFVVTIAKYSYIVF